MLPLIPQPKQTLAAISADRQIPALQPKRSAVSKVADVFRDTIEAYPNQQNQFQSRRAQNGRTVAGEKLVIVSKARRLQMELYQAASEGDLKAIDNLLSEGARADIALGPMGETALHLAARHPKILSKLLATKPNPDIRTRRNETPLYYLLTQTVDTQRTLESIRLLIEAGASANAHGPQHTPLIEAMQREDSLPILHCLLKGGADPNLTNKYGRRPLHGADTAKQVDLLLDAGADIEGLDGKGVTPLISEDTSLAAKHRLLERGANASARTTTGETLIHRLSMQYRQLSRLNSLPLPQAQIDINARDNEGRTPLMKGDDSENAGWTQFLLRHGGNVHQTDNKGLTALHYAHTVRQAFQLLSAGAQLEAVDAKGNTPLLTIAEESINGELLAYLLKVGANVQVANREGETALHKKAYKDYGLEIFAPLLSAAGLKQQPDKKGRLPLHIAASNVNSTGLETLLNLDPQSVNDPDKAGQTPLHVLATGQKNRKSLGNVIPNSQIESTALHLLQANANPNARDVHGRTPIHTLAKLDTIVPLNQFLAKGAEVEPRDKQGMTPADLAWANGRNLSAYRLLKPNTPLTLDIIEAFIANTKQNTELYEPGYNLLQHATKDEVRSLIAQFLKQPERAGAILRQILNLRTFSLDFWNSRSKADWAPLVKQGLTAIGPEPKADSPVLREIRQKLDDVGNEPVTTIAADELLGNCENSQIQIFGRTIAIRQPDQSLLCIKLLDEKENLTDLAREPAVLRVLRKHKSTLGLKSELPTPEGIFQPNDLFKALRAKGVTHVDELERRVKGAMENDCRAYVYHSPANYFDYLNETKIDDEQFQSAWSDVLHDLAVLRRHHIGFATAGLFHAGVGNPLNDQRRYFPLRSLFSDDLSTEGGLEAWVESLKYPNVSLSGLRDFGDIIFYDDLDIAGNRVAASFLTSGNHETFPPFMVANLRVEALLVFELMLAHRVLVQSQNDPSFDPLSPTCISQVSQKLFNAAVINMTHETGAQESQVRLLLTGAVDWELYARQLIFWSNPGLYVPYLKRGELPSWILPDHTVQLMDVEKLKWLGSDLKEDLGFARRPHLGSDFGKVNGEYPVKEGIKGRYLAALIAAGLSSDEDQEMKDVAN